MSLEVSGFALALAVSIITAFVTQIQAKFVVDAIVRRFDLTPVADATVQPDNGTTGDGGASKQARPEIATDPRASEQRAGDLTVADPSDAGQEIVSTAPDAKLEDATAQQLGLDKHPRIALAYVGQALDVATNFPAGILTIYAYLVLPEFPASADWLRLVAAVVWTLASVGLANPRFAVAYCNRWSVKGCSILTALLLLLNLVGLTVALLAGGAAPA